MKEKALFINSGVFSIVSEPKIIQEKMAAIIFCPGTITGTHTSYGEGPIVEMARILAKKGYVTIRFDYRGKGDSRGENKDFTTQSALQDTLVVKEHLRKAYGIDRFGIYGKGGGGYIALRVALEQADIKRAFLFEPILDLQYVKQVYPDYFCHPNNFLMMIKAYPVYAKYYNDIINKNLESLREIPIINSGFDYKIMIGSKNQMTPSTHVNECVEILKQKGITGDVQWLDNMAHDAAYEIDILNLIMQSATDYLGML